MSVFLDASAIVKLIKREPESQALSSFTRRQELVASELVLAEVPRALLRDGNQIGQSPRDKLMTQIDRVLAQLTLVEIDRATLLLAGRLDQPRLRSLDAINVASALLVSVDLESVVTYDERQARAARAASLTVVQPGR